MTFVPLRCFIGFDGFIDEIVRPVASRNGSSVKTFSSIQDFALVCGGAKNKSCNIELVSREFKIGGNGPNMASALCKLGYPLDLIGLFGKEEINPIFLPLTDKCKTVISLEDPGISEALEFSDGKIIFGKHESLHRLTANNVINNIGKERLAHLLDNAALAAFGNWTMLLMMNDLWKIIANEIAPGLSNKKRLLFIDLADPFKRDDRDLTTALELLQELNRYFNVILGLNHAEALRIAELSGLNITSSLDEGWTMQLLHRVKLAYLVIHNAQFSYAAHAKETGTFTPFYEPEPKITTGAGDHFNAGFCHGLLQGGSLKDALLFGNAVAGYYVRHSKSPSIEELAIFLRSWDNINV